MKSSLPDTRIAYNNWASQYDHNNNKTRDLEAVALRTALAPLEFESCLEIGCGTGKNTEWFAEKAREVTAVDLSEEMLQKAREKINSDRVEFKQANILLPWEFRTRLYDLVSFSLVLEHIETFETVFSEVANALVPGGYVYIGELHPFKQYNGSKARFETEEGIQVVQCYNHHISDFIRVAKQYDLHLVDMDEYFDNNDRKEIPRILTILLQKAKK